MDKNEILKKPYNSEIWLSQEDAILKFKYLFFNLERIFLKRCVLFEKKSPKKYFEVIERDAVKYYLKSFQLNYFGFFLFNYEDIKIFENFHKRNEIFSKAIMFEKYNKKIKEESKLNFIPSDIVSKHKFYQQNLEEVKENELRELNVVLPNNSIDDAINYYLGLSDVKF